MVLRPLNIMHIHGTMCCQNMADEWLKNRFSKEWGCYDALTIYEANVLVIWGSLSSKLRVLIKEEMQNMLENRYLLHLRGCHRRIHNDASCSHFEEIPINQEFSDCTLDKTNYTSFIKEARRCLIA